MDTSNAEASHKFSHIACGDSFRFFIPSLRKLPAHHPARKRDRTRVGFQQIVSAAFSTSAKWRV